MTMTKNTPDTHNPDSYTTSHSGEKASGGSFLGHLWASIASTIILVIICCGIYPLIVWALAQLLFPVQANGSLVKKDGSYTTNDQEAVGSAILGQNFAAPQYFHPRPSSAGSGYDAANSSGSNLGPLSDKLLNGATATQPAPTPDTQAAASTSAPASAPIASASQPTTAPQVVETLAFDGVRLRVIHYAVDNGILFKLYNVKYDDAGNITSRVEVALTKFQDKDGNLNETALVDAFPHAGDPADKTPLIAADFATPIPADAVTASGSGLDPHISPENACIQAQRIADARKIGKDKVLRLIEQYTDAPNLGILGDPGVNVLRLNLALDQAAPMPPASSNAATTPASTSK